MNFGDNSAKYALFWQKEKENGWFDNWNFVL
jgi:hypothetical protein